MKAEAVLAVYAGYSLKGAHVDPGPALEPYIQDALDEIEYVAGAVNTPWGARRVATTRSPRADRTGSRDVIRCRMTGTMQA